MSSSPNIFLHDSLLPDPVNILNAFYSKNIDTLWWVFPEKNNAVGHNRIEIRKINHM